MATFKKIYTVSELLKMVEKSTIIPFCWRNGDQIPQFYFVDARRSCVATDYENLHFVTHKSNYYRLKKKIYFLPFRVRIENHCKYDQLYFILEVCPIILGDPFYYDPVSELKRLANEFSKDYKVSTYVL